MPNLTEAFLFDVSIFSYQWYWLSLYFSVQQIETCDWGSYLYYYGCNVCHNYFYQFLLCLNYTFISFFHFYRMSCFIYMWNYMDRVKRIWYLSPMRAAKVQASLRIRAVSPEPSLLAHKSSESRGTFRQKARPIAPLNGWACAVKVCHDGMLEDTNSLDGAHIHVECMECNSPFERVYS